LKNEQLAIGNQQLAKARKKQRDSGPKRGERGTSTVRSSLGRIALHALFATKRLCPVGVWLKDTGRGLQKEIAKIAGIAKIVDWRLSIPGVELRKYFGILV
jgi:hypothetical protein